MSLFILLLAIAAFVAGLHMITTDHWVPLVLVSTDMNFSTRKTCFTASLLGFLHAGTSSTIALLALLVGVLLVKSFASYLSLVAALILAAVGIYFIVSGITLKGESASKSASLGAVLSVSIFPDLALLPIIFAAVMLPIIEISLILILFAAVSAVSLTITVYAAHLGLAKGVERLPPRYMDYVMGATLLITAAIIRLV